MRSKCVWTIDYDSITDNYNYVFPTETCRYYCYRNRNSIGNNIKKKILFKKFNARNVIGNNFE